LHALYSLFYYIIFSYKNANGRGRRSNPSRLTGSNPEGSTALRVVVIKPSELARWILLWRLRRLLCRLMGGDRLPDPILSVRISLHPALVLDANPFNNLVWRLTMRHTTSPERWNKEPTRKQQLILYHIFYIFVNRELFISLANHRELLSFQR
jgi:hypothetical protein